MVLVAVVFALAACTGSGAEPTPQPTSTSTPIGRSPASPAPTTTEPASPTPTEAETPSPSPTGATPTPTETTTPVGIDPPTEAPEGFSEFEVPPPDQLTVEYAAWVLAEIYRAESELIRLTTNTPTETASLPQPLLVGINSTFTGTAADVMRGSLLETIQDPANRGYAEDPGEAVLTNLGLMDATQSCLLMRFVVDTSPLLQQAQPPVEQIVLLEPKPEIDESGFNPTPWRLSERASPEHVTLDRCPS